MLQARSPEQRRRAAYAFCQVHTTVDAVVPQLVPLLDDADREVQRCALIAIQQHGQSATAAIPALRRHAKSRTSPIAAEALITVDLIMPLVDIGPDLIPLLSHEDELVRIQAIRAIPTHLPSDQAELLLAARFSGETGKVRAAIAQAINEARTGSSNLDED
jgi:HEAT repeat protein